MYRQGTIGFLGLFVCLGLLSQGIRWHTAYTKGKKSVEQGNWNEAIENLEQAIQGNPEPSASARMLGSFRTPYFPYYYLGIAYQETSKLSRSIEALEKALSHAELLPAMEVDARKRVEAVQEELRRFERVVEQAKNASENKEYREAISFYDQAEEIYPDGYRAHGLQNLRASVLNREAQRLVREAEVLLEEDRFEEARSRYEEALGLHPGVQPAALDRLEKLLAEITAERAEQAPSAELQEAADRVLEQLEEASIAFNVPDRMELASIAVVQLLLSKMIAPERLESLLVHQGQRLSETAEVSNVMEARLKGSDFEINAITPEKQVISSNQLTVWKWEARALKPGLHMLHLTLTAIVRLDDYERQRAIRTFEKSILVEVTLRSRLGKFLSGNWQWLITAVLIPVGGWLWRRRSKRNDEGHTPPPASALAEASESEIQSAPTDPGDG